MAGLLGAEKIAGAAQLQVAHCEAETGAKPAVAHQRVEAFARVRVHDPARRQQKQRPALFRGAADAASELVEVGEAEHVRVGDYYRVRAGDVDAGLHNGGRQEYVVFAAFEIAHLAGERLRVHLPVGDDGFRVGADRLEALLGAAHRGDAVVKVEDLAAAREFRLDRGADDVVVVSRHARFDGDALARGRPQKRQVARAGHRKVQRAGYGRRRQRQHVGRRP